MFEVAALILIGLVAVATLTLLVVRYGESGALRALDSRRWQDLPHQVDTERRFREPAAPLESFDDVRMAALSLRAKPLAPTNPNAVDLASELDAIEPRPKGTNAESHPL